LIIKKQIPLLHDHHTHTSIYAALHNCIDLRFVEDKSTALKLISESRDDTTIVLGWNNSLYDFKEDELNAFPSLIICNASLHKFLINRKTREKFFDLHRDMIEHIDDDEWVENNIYFILTTLAKIKETGSKEINVFLNDLLQNHGIWQTEDMLLPEDSTLQRFKEAGVIERTQFWADPETYQTLNDESKKYIKGLKIFTDGAIGAQTAALKGKYSTGETGLLNFEPFELFEQIEQANSIGTSISIHAIGDMATEQVITVLQDFNKQNQALPPVRIEHCQFISKENAITAKDLGVTLSMQPNFNSDSFIYRDRLSEKYLQNNNPFRMLIDEAGFMPGEDLIFGSDGMPHGVQYALEQSLFPLYPGQRLTLDEFVMGYCLEDTEKGFVEVEVDNEFIRVKTRIVINI